MDEPILEILEAWRSKGNFGLTLPFLFGALCQHPDKPLSGNNAKDKLESLIKLTSKSDSILRLSYCDKANDLILAPVRSTPLACKNVDSTRLWIQHDVVSEEKATIRNLHASLWVKYGTNLEQGNYSCTNGCYHPFSEKDQILIREAFE